MPGPNHEIELESRQQFEHAGETGAVGSRLDFRDGVLGQADRGSDRGLGQLSIAAKALEYRAELARGFDGIVHDIVKTDKGRLSALRDKMRIADLPIIPAD